MTIFGMLYKLLIGPLELLFEVIFVIANRKVSNPAYAIIALSLAMNFLVLPLYRRADAMQAEERDREERMRPWIDHIKKTFKGDERFMMLQTYYRQNNYRPTDVFKGSVSLFLEIPFFIAAYRFLSGLETLKGISFGPITDLGAPDALINIGGTAINFLPILMTLINVVSAAVYMRGMPLRNKIQTYGIAAIFLVLLYNSPAGLVFYWTLNQVFSLLKNVFYKFKDPARVLRILASASGIVLLALVLIKHPFRSKRVQLVVIAALLCLQLPLLIEYFRKRHGGAIAFPLTVKQSNFLFNASAALLAVLTGLLCPSAVIGDSAEEFINLSNYVSPNWYIVSAFLLAAGTFIIWFGIFYRLADDTGKHIISLVMAMAAVIGLMNYMLFSTGFGNLSTDLQFDDNPVISGKLILLNMAASLAVMLLIALIWKYKSELLRGGIAIVCVALVIMSGVNIASINQVLAADSDMIKSAATAEEPELSFSKEGKNVLVIMMDRMAGPYIPYIVEEKPELKEMFDGFTYCSNVTSHATTTNEGAPALYGGYDYTPAEINKRDTESLASKNDEALKVMPTLFGEAGYEVTICEPTYAGYKQIPDLSIFDDHPEYKTFNLNGRFSLEEYGYVSKSDSNDVTMFRNFFCYSLFRITPSVLQKTVYAKGSYNSSVTGSFVAGHTMSGSSKSHGFVTAFMKYYAVLCHLKDITRISKDDQGSFIMMSNDTTHEAMLLQEPDYVPAVDVDNTEYDAEHPTRTDANRNVLEFETDNERQHYHINMAAMLKLGEYFDYLKEKGVYDNTRIIIVSDHGTPYRWKGPHSIYYHDNYSGEDTNLDIRRFACTLMYKDFDAEGFTIDDGFTTNADVPAIALDGIVDNPVNPFTGNRIVRGDESLLPLQVIRTREHSIKKNNGNTFIPGNIFEVNGNVNDINSWKYIGNE